MAHARIVLAALAANLVAVSLAHADDDVDPSDSAGPQLPFQFDVSATGGALIEQRAGVGDPSLLAPFGVGAELRVMTLDRAHGAMLAYTFAPTLGAGLGAAGPTLHAVDLAYALRPPDASGFSVEIGPSIAFVSHTLAMGSSAARYEDVPEHATFGGRVSVTFRTAPTSGVLFGIELGYRGGVPVVEDIGYGVPTWEGTPFLMLSLGGQTVSDPDERGTRQGSD